MDSDSADVLSRHPVPRYRLSLDDYHRLGEAGILGEDDRVELLEGQLVEMSPIGPRHAFVVDELNSVLNRAIAGRARVRVQNPIALGDRSEPQPDLVVAQHPWQGYPRSHPGPKDILLLVEVADSSRDLDLGAKRELYARAGIREFWIVDLTVDAVVVCRGPEDGSYRSVVLVERSGMLTVEALAGVSVPAAPLFV